MGDATHIKPDGSTTFIQPVEADGTLDVHINGSALPAGAATAAKQDLQTADLDAINTATAATSASATSINTHASAIDTATAAIKTATDTINTSTSASKTDLDTINTATAAIKTATDTINTSTAAIKTNSDSILTHQAAIDTATAASKVDLDAIKTDDDAINTATAALNGKFQAAAIPADAESNAGTMSRIMAFVGGLNVAGAWDRLRTAVVIPSATLTGMLNQLPWAVFHTTPTTRTTGQGGPLEALADGSLITADSRAPNYEDQTVGRAMVEMRYNTTRISTATATNDIATGPGYLSHITFGKLIAAQVLDVYDALTVTGTPIFKYTAPTVLAAPPLTIYFNRKFTTGITINTAQADDFTVHWRGTAAP